MKDSQDQNILIKELYTQIEALKAENNLLKEQQNNQKIQADLPDQTSPHGDQVLTPQCKFLLNYFPDGIAVLNQNLEFVHINHSFEELTGQSADSLVGNVIPLTIFEESAVLISKILSDAFKSESEKDFYFTIRKTSLLYYYAKIVPLKHEGFQSPKLLLICRDITNLKKFELSLLKSEQNWKRLVNNFPEIIVRFDKNLKFIFVNDTLLKYVNVNRKEFIGKNSEELGLQLPEDSKFFTEQIKRVFEKQEPIHFYNYFGDSVNKKFFYVSLVPEFSTDGTTVESVVGLTRDITEVQQSRLKIEKQNQELKRINEHLDNFVHIMAHDFRGPLTILSLLKDQLRDCDDEAMREEFFNMLGRAVNQLNTQLVSLNEIIRLEAGHTEAKQTCCLQETVQKVSQKLRDDLTALKVTIKTDFEAAPNVLYPPSHLECIMTNLVNNSLKYRDLNRDSMINIEAADEAKYVKITYEDNSKGVQFNSTLRPVQVDSGEKKNSSELGLYILKNIIERNEGQFFINSEPGKGTVFTIKLKK